ncbi:NUDIX domain-containing protein [Tellurirhabdus bombi]|uniref:NUDIX domain-containing protein n=1 Tax=Tellurirhabdus bombi TaxID=2907205 RepID=UPI001F1DCB74|nr:NUDIX domain-containing protein [Tellurirhabdus bombi]
MDKARQEVVRLYGNRLRLRVCGLCLIDGKLLMVRHRGINSTDTFWCPPGGGPQFSETAPEALVREFLEETGLEVVIEDLLFVNEFMLPPLHALELFFKVKIVGGQLGQGSDPEMDTDQQIITEVRLMTFEEIKAYPETEVHQLFRQCDTMDDIFRLRGYLNK